jgi:hypothetical protein
MSTVILSVVGILALALYLLKRRARLRAEEGSDNY